MCQPVASRIYDLYSVGYDYFAPFFRARLKRAISGIAFNPGDHVLDVGIGTGLSLEYYPPSVHVTGIDQSEAMLDRARRKVERKLVRSAPNCGRTRLLQGDALSLPFGNRTFDVVFLSHVLATVANPRHCLAEAIRVARDYACIVLVNHFESTNPWLGTVETMVDPICRRLGWRTAVSLETLLRRLDVQNVELATQNGSPFFATIYLQKNKSSVRVLPVPAPMNMKNMVGAGI